MNQVLTALQDLETFIGGLRFEKKADGTGILPELGIIPMIEEYASFLRSLSFCKKVAASEYQYVQGEIGRVLEIGKGIRTIQEKTQQISIDPAIIIDSDQNAPDQEKTAEALRKTIRAFSCSLEKSINDIQKKTEQLKDDLSVFKIVLFGKTKSGKSTVREALTKGNGASIGKGGQSTTTEIHEYDWYNLKVYDTPGSLSVRDTEKKQGGIGKEEHMAYELLLKSDIAIFMFISDNIEKAELDYLREILERGKDVLILLNVKSDLSDYRKFKLRKKEKEISEEFQQGNFERIREAVGKRNPKILPFHAQAAFFSRGNSGELKQFYRDNDVTRSELYDLSKFSEIRNYLVENIIERGAAIRSETIRECFISHVRHFSAENRRPIEQCRKNVEDVLGLIRKTKKKIDGIINSFGRKLESELRSEFRARIDTHDIAETCIDCKYSKEEIKRFWESQFSDELVKEVSTGILQTLIQKISAEMEEMSRQLSFIMETDAEFDGFEANTLPWEDILRVGGILAGIGSMVAFFFFSGPVGWVLGGISIVLSLLAGIFKRRETKIRELKEKLDDSFDENIKSLAEHLREHCKKNVYPIIRGNLNHAISAQEELLKICDDFLVLNQELDKIAKENQKKLAPHIKQLISEQKALLARNK